MKPLDKWKMPSTLIGLPERLEEDTDRKRGATIIEV